MLVLLMAVCNQSYLTFAFDEGNSSAESYMVSDENESVDAEVATDSDAGMEEAEENLEPDTVLDMDDAPARQDTMDEGTHEKEEKAEKTEKTYPSFAQSCSIDGVHITVTASEGVFPEGAELNVSKVTADKEAQIDQAVNVVRNADAFVAQSYTYDIKVLDENGTEIQPADGQTVNVSFAMDEVANRNLSTDIYHIPGETGNLVAEELSTSESGNTVTAVSDGFSYYTVEFTYNEKQYVMEGDSSVALTDILSYVGITKADGNAATDSDITAVSVSDESLFSASKESGEWIVTAHQAFTSNEWMKVTVDGVEYEIVVTDAVTQNFTFTLSNVNSLTHNITGATYNKDTKFVFNGYNNNRKGPNNGGPENMFIGITFKDAKGNQYHPTISYSGNSNGEYSNSGYLRFAAGNSSGGGTGPTSCTFTLDSLPNDAAKWKICNIGQTCANCGGGVYFDLVAVAEPATNPTLTNTTANYDGSAHAIGTSGGSGGIVQYATSEDNSTWSDWTTTVPRRTEPGTTYVKAKVVGDNFHNDSTETSVHTLVINEPSTAPTLTGWSGTYDGNSHSVTASGASGGTVYYRTSTDNSTWGSWSATVPSRKDTGTTYVQAYTKGDSTHSDSSVTTSVQITITPKTVTGAIQTIPDQTYTGSNITPSITVKDGNTVIAASEYNVSYSDNKDVGTATVTVSDKTGGNYTVSGSTTFTITKAPLTITANDKTITYGDAPANNGVSFEGFLGTDNDSVLNGALSYSYTYTQNQNVGEYVITPGGVTATNYDITFVNGKLIVNPKSVNIPQLSDIEKIYNGEYLSPTVSTYDSELITQSGVVSAKNAGNYLVNWSLNNTTNYKWSDNSTAGKNATWSISPKNITVTADNKSKIFGEEDPALTYSVSENGLVGSDTLSNINLSRTDGENVGTYTINVSQSTGSNPNYDITFVPGTFTIGTKSITPEVALSQDTFTYNRGQQVPTVYVRYNGTDMSPSDFEVLYSADGNSYTSTIDSKDKGTYYIKVVAKDSGNYTFDSITKTYTINPKPMDASMVTLTDESYVYDGNEKQPVVTVKDGSATLNDTEYEIDASSERSATTYGNYNIVINGTGNYTGSYTAIWSITKKAIEGVTIHGVDTTYDGEKHKLDVTVPAGATITYGNAAGAYTDSTNPEFKDAGVHTVYYKIEVDDNYETIEGLERVIIRPKQITLTTVDQTITYGDDEPVLGYSVVGLIDGETLTGITLSREAGEDVGEYQILAESDTSKDTNYDITIVNTGKLTIKPKAVNEPEIVVEDQTYTGREIKPTVIVKDGNRIIPGTEYTVEYTDNVKRGKGKVTITDVPGGNYVLGTREATFNIIDPGVIEVIEPEKPNANGADLAEAPSEIISKIPFTKEEKEAQEGGKNIFVFLEVEDISDSVPAADKKLIERALDSVVSGSDGKSTELKVGMFLDISLFKQIEGENKVKVSQTTGAMKIAFDIPATLRKDGRSFYIVKVHGGVTTLITPVQNGNTLIFVTDQFSTYALVYTDAVVAPATVTPAATPTSKANVTATGDTPRLGVVFILMILATMGIVILCRTRKKQ